MPVYRGSVTITTGATFVPDLRPNDRFAGRGGTVRIRAAVLSTGALAGAVGDILQTVFIGNEMVENRGPVPPLPQIDNFTPALDETGLAAEVINVVYVNTNAASRVVLFFIEIQNAGF